MSRSKLLLLFLFACLSAFGQTTLTTTLNLTSANNGQTFNNYRISTTSGPCIKMTSVSNVTISASNIGPCGQNNSDADSNGIEIIGGTGNKIYDSYIHVENRALTNSFSSTASHAGVQGLGTANLTVQGNVVCYGSANVRAFKNGGVPSTGWTVNGNYLCNPRGYDGSGNNFQAANSYAMTVTNNYAFSCVIGASTSSTRIPCPTSPAYLYTQFQEDSINFYYATAGDLGSNNAGTVAGNYIVGGEGVSGVAIAFDQFCSRLTASNNTSINTGLVGPTIADGIGNVITGNRSWMGNPISVNNTGITVHSIYGHTCSGGSLTNNTARQHGGTNGSDIFVGNPECLSTNSGNVTGTAAEAALGLSGAPTWATIQTSLPPPKIPPVPKNCTANSPYTNQTSLPLCNAPTPPTITSFTANPSVIASGASSTLSWVTGGATSLVINPGNINVTGLTSTVVSPTISTLYTLTATNANGSTQAQAQVTVTGATTYYVSSSGGNDNNAGTTTGLPWQSIAKVKTGPPGGYQPGTTIAFKAGDTWSGVAMNTLTPGTSPQRITYTSYGAGAKPIIDGTFTVGTLFTISDNFITIDGLDLRNSTSQLITAPGRGGIIVKNCSLRNAGGHVFNSSFAIAGSMIFDNNTYTVDSGRPSSTNMVEIWTDQNASIRVTNSTLDRRLASGALNGSGIAIAGAWGAVMTGNVVRGGTQGIGVKPYQRPSDGVNCQPGDPGTQDGIISHNYMDNISTRQGDGEPVELEGCAAGVGGDQTNFTVSNNVIVCMSDLTVGVGSSDAIGGFHASGSKVWGNLIFGGCGIATGSTTPRIITWSSASTNNNTYNNTIVGPGVGAGPSPLSAIAYLSSSSGIARNNIITGVERGISQYTSSTVTEGNNLFFNVSSNTFGTVTHLGSTLVGDPIFAVTNPTDANGAKLQSGSPAVGSGANLGTPYNLINDPAGAGPFIYPDFNQSTSWMRGAFGFGGGPPPPIITDFEASPTSINSGQSSQLTCTASNFTNLQIVGVGNIASGVPVTVSPTVTTQYDCRATNTVSHVDAFATVSVNAPPPVITSFTATPVTIITGQSSTLQWTSTGATTCSINQGIGTVGCNTSRAVNPTTTTTYRLTATNSASVSDFQDVTVAVNVPTTILGATMQGAIIP